MFLNALSNRGLLTQQNGKFVYVGDKNKSTMQQGMLESLVYLDVY